MSNSTCGPGLPCVIEARSRREKAVPSALPAMSELPKLITINQAESIEGFSKDRNSRQTTEVKEWGRDCETENRMTYLHRKPHTERRVSHKRSIETFAVENLWCKTQICNIRKSSAYYLFFWWGITNKMQRTDSFDFRLHHWWSKSSRTKRYQGITRTQHKQDRKIN